MTQKRITLILTTWIIFNSLLAQASILFNDNFEGNLSQWTGKQYGTHHGIIVNDPLRQNNKVLSFNGLNNGGDMFSIPGITLEDGKIYEFSLEYLGLAVSNSTPDNYGGFAGLSDVVDDPFTDKAWFFGTRSNYPYLRDHLIDDGQWRKYSYEFIWHRSEINASDDTVHVYLEDWISSGSSIGDVYFDNINLMEVPEPISLLLFSMGSYVLLQRRKV